MNDTRTRQEKYMEWLAKAIYLAEYGWHTWGDWPLCQFEKGDKIYDLSAADITKHESIEKNGFFLVDWRGEIITK